LGAFDEGVEIVDIGLVMFAVVVVKGLGGDGLSEGGFGVGEFGEYKAHFFKFQIMFDYRLIRKDLMVDYRQSNDSSIDYRQSNDGSI